MPRIIDNIDQQLLPILRDSLAISERAGFCVGYFNLRGWRTIDDLISGWQSDAGPPGRALIGMQRPPHEDVKALYQVAGEEVLVDNARASEVKHKLAAHLRVHITFGVPTAADENGLQRLAKQQRESKVQVKLLLPYPLTELLPGKPAC